MMPCHACEGSKGLNRVRRKGLPPRERLYRCADCHQLWRCDERALERMVPALGTVETTGETVASALPEKPVGRLVGFERGQL